MSLWFVGDGRPSPTNHSGRQRREDRPLANRTSRSIISSTESRFS